jgi:hypothetical protein
MQSAAGGLILAAELKVKQAERERPHLHVRPARACGAKVSAGAAQYMRQMHPACVTR